MTVLQFEVNSPFTRNTGFNQSYFAFNGIADDCAEAANHAIIKLAAVI
jgi:hypothetical protein